jgi:hypothetical protein
LKDGLGVVGMGGLKECVVGDVVDGFGKCGDRGERSSENERNVALECFRVDIEDDDVGDRSKLVVNLGLDSGYKSMNESRSGLAKEREFRFPGESLR